MTRLRLATGETLRSFRTRNFRVYFAGQAISQTGTWLQLVAQTLLVLRLERSATALGLLTAIQFLPVLAFGSFAGLLADRFDKRRILYLTQSLMVGPALLLGVLTITGRITTTGVFVLAGVTGLVNAFDNPSRRVILSELVSPEDVPNAVSLNSTLMTGARIAAPAVAAALISTVGIGWCFLVNALSFLAGLIAVRLLDTTQMSAPVAVVRSGGQVREGLRYVWADRELRLAMTLMTVVSTLAFNWTVVMPIFVNRTLGRSERSYLLLSICLSAGSFLGALALARRRTVELERVVVLAACFGASMTALAFAPNLASAIAIGVFTGGFGITYLSSTASLLQVRAAPEMRGRVIALHAVVFLGSTPLGGPVAGFVTEHAGARAGLLLGAVPTVIASLAVLRVLRRRPVAAHTAADAHLETGLRAA